MEEVQKQVWDMKEKERKQKITLKIIPVIRTGNL